MKWSGGGIWCGSFMSAFGVVHRLLWLPRRQSPRMKSSFIYLFYLADSRKDRCCTPVSKLTAQTRFRLIEAIF